MVGGKERERERKKGGKRVKYFFSIRFSLNPQTIFSTMYKKTGPIAHLSHQPN